MRQPTLPGRSSATSYGKKSPRFPDLPVRQVGPVGPAGAPGSAIPLRFAHVLHDGTVDAANSRGITQDNLSVIDTGDVPSGCPCRFYVFDGFSSPVTGAQVTEDYSEKQIHGTRAQVSVVGGGFSVSIPDSTASPPRYASPGKRRRRLRITTPGASSTSTLRRRRRQSRQA